MYKINGRKTKQVIINIWDTEIFRELTDDVQEFRK